jgi:hypothetical protein
MQVSHELPFTQDKHFVKQARKNSKFKYSL